MDMFSALGQPTRRDIIELLATHGKLSATDISNKFQMSAPAISQHLKVLREARLVDMEKNAQQRLYTLNPATMQELEGWIKKMTRQWDERFDRLEKLLEKGVKKYGK
jgi:DNA-binding transcriptional ArsR family regulator